MKKILLHTVNQFCVDSFERSIKNTQYDIIRSFDEESLFGYCGFDPIDAYVISGDFEYSQRGVDSIRGQKNNVVIVGIQHPNSKLSALKNVDVNFIVYGAEATDAQTSRILNFIEAQEMLYSKIIALTPKSSTDIRFGEGYLYDSSYRSFYCNGIQLKYFSAKEGKILEILSRNFRNVVNRDEILKEIWGNIDIFCSRSLDVHITKIRNFFREYEVGLTIKNISGVGLILT